MSEASSPRPRRPGYSLPEAAKALGWPYNTLAKAVKNGEAHCIEFAGSRRMSLAEVQRLRALFEEGPAEDAA